ncbi:hypothetical protein [Arthrobacter sp. V4I6]|uniref:hypothetical protein n=1 Tax=unclassified Arthrobacter TaxID=235627 RepID=UPI003593E09B
MRWAGALAPLLGAEIRAVTAWEFEIPTGHWTPAVANPDRVARGACSEAVSKARRASLASSTSTKESGGHQTLSSIRALTLREFFPSTATIGPGIMPLILGLDCDDARRLAPGVGL